MAESQYHHTELEQNVGEKFIKYFHPINFKTGQREKKNYCLVSHKYGKSIKAKNENE